MNMSMRCSRRTRGVFLPRPTSFATGSKAPAACWSGVAQTASDCWELKVFAEEPTAAFCSESRNPATSFLAWSDQPWVLDGAAVHTSIVGFDKRFRADRQLDGAEVESINANLSFGADLTAASRLHGNLSVSFIGPSPKAPFDITPELATKMLDSPKNINGRPNSDVVRPVMNARDISQRPRGMYTIDFGVDLSEEDAAYYEAPFEYIRTHVKPVRVRNRRARYAELWWMYAEARPGMRKALSGLSRYIATPRVSKHRLFVWITSNTMCNDSNGVFARDDDYTFGVLHSRFHEVWALAMGTQLESRPRYTPTTCFETFPFPEPTDAQRLPLAMPPHA